jgi:hypothetical protein
MNYDVGTSKVLDPPIVRRKLAMPEFALPSIMVSKNGTVATFEWGEA